MLTVVPDVVVGDSDGAATPSVSLLDEIVREGARRMLAASLGAEVAAYIDAHAHEPDEQGRRLVVRNSNDLHPLPGSSQEDGMIHYVRLHPTPSRSSAPRGRRG